MAIQAPNRLTVPPARRPSIGGRLRKGRPRGPVTSARAAATEALEEKDDLGHAAALHIEQQDTTSCEEFHVVDLPSKVNDEFQGRRAVAAVGQEDMAEYMTVVIEKSPERRTTLLIPYAG